jgi:hypothetical protein
VLGLFLHFLWYFTDWFVFHFTSTNDFFSIIDL